MAATLRNSARMAAPVLKHKYVPARTIDAWGSRADALVVVKYGGSAGAQSSLYDRAKDLIGIWWEARVTKDQIVDTDQLALAFKGRNYIGVFDLKLDVPAFAKSYEVRRMLTALSADVRDSKNSFEARDRFLAIHSHLFSEKPSIEDEDKEIVAEALSRWKKTKDQKPSVEKLAKDLSEFRD